MTAASPHRDDLVLTGVLAASAGLVAALQWGGVDTWLADAIYRAEGGHWALRELWWTSTLLHSRARDAVTVLWIALLAAWQVDVWRRCWPARIRAALGYVVVAVAACAALVTVLKHTTAVACPWDLARYGGRLEAGGAFAGPGVCFPGGHAAAGYAWLALYFALAHVAPRWRFTGLAAGLMLGLAFGLVQQLRGAHFLSHDVAAAALCWGVSALLAKYWPWTHRINAPPMH